MVVERNDFWVGVPLDVSLPQRHDLIAQHVGLAITEVIGESLRPGSELTVDQVTNVFSHILQAHAYLEGGDKAADDEALLERGALGLSSSAGLFVSLRSREFGQKITRIGQQLGGVPIGAMYRVRYEWRAPNRSHAENAELYRELGLWSIQLAYEQREFLPRFPDTLLLEKRFGSYMALEIADWLLDTESSQ